MQSVQSSRIPHLAYSLATRRATAAARAIQLQSRADGSLRNGFKNTTYNRPLVYPGSTVRHASSKSRPPPPPPPSSSSKRIQRSLARAPPSQTPRPSTEDYPDDVLPSKNDFTSRTQQHRRRFFNVYLWGGSIFSVTLALYLTMVYISYKRSIKISEGLDLEQDADVSSRWNDLGRDFDDEVDWSEKAMRLHKKRAKLCQQAHGNVLEVSCGTGRNMKWYNFDPRRMPRKDRIVSLVFNDQSEIMVYQAQKKYEALMDEKAPGSRFRGSVKFLVGDAGDRRTIDRPPGGFDTIVQTMGICSMANPVAFLKRMAELARQPGEVSVVFTQEDAESNATLSSLSPTTTSTTETPAKPTRDYGAPEFDDSAQPFDASTDNGGRILLLEHGRSKYEFINRFMDSIAKEHADRYGCWFNKDIEQIVRDSGLVVERMRRYNFGTTYEFVLRPPRQVDGVAGGNESKDKTGS